MSDITITGMLGQVDSLALSFLNETYPTIASAVSTPVYLAAVLYWALHGYKIYAGHTSMQWKDLLSKAVLTVGVFGALNWGGFAMLIYKGFMSFMEGAATTLLAGQSSQTLLDTLFKNGSAVANVLMRSSFYQMGMVLAGFGLFALNCILFVVALAYMTVAKVGLAITMVFLPVFASFFFFDQTRHWGTNWLNKMMTFSMMYVLVTAVVKFGFQAFQDVFDAVGTVASNASAVATADNFSLVSSDVFMLCVVEGALILFMLSVRSWAAALASGAAAGTGILMMVARSAMSKGSAR